ncbi:MAG: tRNA (adenosine(37)-N6)-threonylcarbamoyltransferase complex dimerization subunit type 1 TsaB [Deferrisomatales bacterium]|nr:tRNA (adenosine(37)-N6)-threonylcarbamoyltransferase complex dimerization subunit type 1 TsaB [Deferrisomatales bacterium]
MSPQSPVRRASPACAGLVGSVDAVRGCTPGLPDSAPRCGGGFRPLLALDTADGTAGVALLVEGRVVAELVEASAYRHSERLFALVDEALAGAGIGPGELGGVAVTVGPGSFTGLRVGLATAKGMAFALGLPAAGVSTLEALARGAMPFPGWVVPALDARKGQVYGAAYHGRSGACGVLPGAWLPRELADRARELGGPFLALGSGLGPYRAVFEEALGEGLCCAPPSRWHISPAQVALLGERAFREGRASPPAALAPVYLRRSEAEEARERRRGG